MKFLEEEKGINIDIPKTKNANYDVINNNYPEELQLAKDGKFDWISEYKKPEFVAKVEKELDKKLAIRGKDTAKEVYGEEGIVNIARDRAQTIDATAKYEGKPDRYEARKLIDEQLKDFKGEFTDYANKLKEEFPYKSTFTEGGKTKSYTERKYY